MLFVHVNHGQITSTAAPRGHGEYVSVDGIASVPGTRSVCASGSLPRHDGHGPTGVISKYGS
jgi:hypothetical protein